MDFFLTSSETPKVEVSLSDELAAVGIPPAFELTDSEAVTTVVDSLVTQVTTSEPLTVLLPSLLEDEGAHSAHTTPEGNSSEEGSGGAEGTTASSIADSFVKLGKIIPSGLLRLAIVRCVFEDRKLR